MSKSVPKFFISYINKIVSADNRNFNILVLVFYNLDFKYWSIIKSVMISKFFWANILPLVPEWTPSSSIISLEFKPFSINASCNISLWQTGTAVSLAPWKIKKGGVFESK